MHHLCSYGSGVIFTLRKGNYKINYILDEECDFTYHCVTMLNKLNKYEEDHNKCVTMT